MSDNDSIPSTANIECTLTWKIGLCAANERVEWLYFDNEQETRSYFQHISKRRKESAVSFRSDLYMLQVESIHPFDIAVILEANRIVKPGDSVTSVDRDAVERLVNSGEAPLVPPARSKLQQWLLKRAMDLVFNQITVRHFAASPLRATSLYNFNVREHPSVRNHVALSLDDAPCRFALREQSSMSDVCGLLQRYNAHATFMVYGSAIVGHEQDLIAAVLQGHELGNHGMLDRAYDKDAPEGFAKAVDDCNELIRKLYDDAGKGHNHVCKYFRAPHAKYTNSMEAVLKSRRMINVMCDTYASCPIVEDGNYIADRLGRKAHHGSIILLHMPEGGFRHWCLVALGKLLHILQARGMQVVSVGMLECLGSESTQNVNARGHI